MSAVSVTIGADTSQFDAAVKGLPEKVNRASAGMARAGGGGGFRGIGMASMQFQDIAVQAQMGAKWSVIIAQQVPQLLSAFGPSGMIIGGIVAIGGAFVTMGENAANAFTQSKNEAADFHKEVQKVLATGSSPELINSLEKIDVKIRSITDKVGELSGLFNVSQNIADIFGGPGVEELLSNASKELNQTSSEYRETLNGLMSASKQQTEIAEMRARGEKDAADQMERQLKLGKELAKIESMKIPRLFKKELIDDAQRRFVAEGPQEKSQGNILSRTMDLFSNKFQMAAGPVMQAIKQQLTEQAGQLTKNAGDLSRAAFSPLRGDMDISTGRGSNINSLRSTASSQIQQMMKQSALLKSQADKIDQSNKLLGDIAGAVKAFNPQLSYN